MPDITTANASDFNFLGDWLETETQKLEKFSRLRSIIRNIGSLANTAGELQSRIDANRQAVADTEKRLADIRATVPPAKAEAQVGIAAARTARDEAIAQFERDAEAERNRIDATIADKRAQLAELSARFDNLKAALA